jgi:GH24 family phage-related lysozyme (muramidase)
MPTPRNSYTFKEGLTMMAAKAIGVDPYLAAEGGENARAAINAIRNAAKTKQSKDRAEYVREAQNELRAISAAQHPKLVNALQAKLLALQGRGRDTEVAHVAPGEMVIPRAMLTPEVMELITNEAQRRGIDPRRLMVGGQGSINPATGAEEFGWFGDVLTGFGNKVRDVFSFKSAGAVEPDQRRLDVESIPVTASRRAERLSPPSALEIGPITVSAIRRPHLYDVKNNPHLRVEDDAAMNQAININKRWEGFKPEKYEDPMTGIVTSGWGNVNPKDTKANVGEKITPHFAEQNIYNDAAKVVRELNDPRLQKLAPHQLAAVVSLGSNIGAGRLKSSDAYQKLMAGDYQGMEKEWREFRNATKNGVKTRHEGLVNRRDDEMNLFFGRPRVAYPGKPFPNGGGR